MVEALFDRITIIGLGLIGSSIARAAHDRGLAQTIVGCDANEVSSAYARKHGFIDIAMHDPAAAVAKSQLVILATPPAMLGEVAEKIGRYLPQGCILMDMASIKQAAIAAIAPHIPAGVAFIPAHPIAGSEQSGVSAGRADLFQRKRVIITPPEPLGGMLLETITAFWQSIGARVEGMPPAIHDMIYAYVSHLPQLLSIAAVTPLAEYLPPAAHDENLKKFVRLAQSNPVLWSEILTLNKDNVLKALDRYLDVVSHIRNELNSAPPEAPKENKIKEGLAHTLLFPRIAASCLITTVMEAEKQAGFSFARYAGTGFADFTAASASIPDEDIEQISNHYRAVVSVIGSYTDRLATLRAAIASGDAAHLREVIEQR